MSTNHVLLEDRLTKVALISLGLRLPAATTSQDQSTVVLPLEDLKMEKMLPGMASYKRF